MSETRIVDVNGSLIPAPPQVLDRLNSRFVHGKECCKAYSYQAPHWACTRPKDHVGVHIAHATNDDNTGVVAVAVFTRTREVEHV